MGAAAAKAHKTRIGMIACRFARAGFFIRLRIRHALADAFENLFLGNSGIFQAANFRAAQRRFVPQPALQNRIDSSIGKSDQPQHDGVAADDFEPIGFCNFQNHGSRPEKSSRARQKNASDTLQRCAALDRIDPVTRPRGSFPMQISNTKLCLLSPAKRNRRPCRLGMIAVMALGG